jgi:hypothetical protein
MFSRCKLMKLLGFMAAMLLVFAPDGHAADSDARYVIYGGSACWDYIVWQETKNAAELEKLEAWISGYVSAYNRQTPDTFTLLGGRNLNAAMAWLAQWCRANPKSRMDAALLALTEEFHPARYRTEKDAAK